MLYHRGVQGIIMDVPKDGYDLNLDWDRFSTIVISDEKRDLKVNMVTTNWASAFDTAVQAVLKSDFKRIGFVIWKYMITIQIWL